MILKVVTRKDHFPKNAPNCLVSLVEMTDAPGHAPADAWKTGASRLFPDRLDCSGAGGKANWVRYHHVTIYLVNQG